MSRRWVLLSLFTVFSISVGVSLFAFSALERFSNGSFDLEAIAVTSVGRLVGSDLLPALIGAVGFFALGLFHTRIRPWAVNRSRSPWRIVLILLLTASMLGWLGVQIGPTVVGGWKLDPEILAADPTLFRRSWPPTIDPPRGYTKHPAILRVHRDEPPDPLLSFKELEAARKIWLEYVCQAWPPPGEPTDTPLLRGFVARPEISLLSSPGRQESERQMEVAVRTAVIDPYADKRLTDFWARDSHTNWRALADLASSANWRPPSFGVDERRVWSEFHACNLIYEKGTALGEQARYDGQFLINWYRLHRDRARLNYAAESFRAVRTQLRASGKPWSSPTVDTVRGFSWGMHHSTVLYEALKRETDRRETAELALRLELKNLQSQGKPQPKTSSELRPPFNEIAETYVEWFSLDKLWNELLSAK